MRYTALVLFVTACGATADAPPGPATTTFSGVAAVKVLPAPDGWLTVLETPRSQALVTVPARSAAFLTMELSPERTFAPLDGWTLIDATVHPSGDVTLVSVKLDPAAEMPLGILLSRHRPDGTRIDLEVPRVAPADPDQSFVSSLDRVRVAADGEDVILAARWAGNSVVVSRYDRDLEERWATRTEPDALVLFVGIIGGGFDNFHQGDETSFVHLAVDENGAAFVAVRSTEDVLPAHEAAFGDDLGADPGTAILTRVDADGTRHPAHLVGARGDANRLIGLRADHGTVLLFGRSKMGTTPEAWDAWIAATDDTGVPRFDRTLDIDLGDMFWDAAPLADGRIVAVGSTSYTQNPGGLSVSDERAALAAVLDSRGDLVTRLSIPHGTTARGDEAISVFCDGENVAVAGMLDGPGTHAEVFADGFLDVQPLR